ncbi:MAG: hypothetical protein ABR573_07305, partial [Candidatus Dormibacteria bacterium]
FPPLLLIIGHAVVSSARTARALGLALGAITAAQLLTGEEMLGMAALTAVIGGTVLFLMRPAAAWGHRRRVQSVLAWSMVTFIPLAAVPLAVQFAGPQRPAGTLHEDVAGFRNDLLTFVLPSTLQALDPPQLQDLSAVVSGGENIGYVGVPLLLLSGVAILRFRRDPVAAWAASTALGLLLLSLGDTLRVDGRLTWIPMPWRVLEHVPLLGNTLAPRLMVGAYLLVGIVLAAAFGAGSWRRPRLIMVVGALGLVALLPPLTYPAGRNDVPAFFRRGGVNHLNPGDVAVVTPLVLGASETMLWQASADMRFRMPGGYMFIPGPGTNLLYAQPSPLRNALNDAASGLTPTTLDGNTRQAMARDLAHWSARAIIVGPTANAPQVLAFVTELMRRPPEASGGVYVWWDVEPSQVL